FTVVLNLAAPIAVQMKMGKATETVEVTSTAPILKTETTQVDTIIDSATNDRLPLATRNYVELTLLSPGSVSPDPTFFNNADNTANGPSPYTNRNRYQQNHVTMNG